jgi:transcriptional regulator with XRE-family HTH domain
MTIRLQFAIGNDFDLALPIQRNISPLADRRFANPERASKRGLRSKVRNGVLFFHDAVSMACRTEEDKNTVPNASYALGMETITERINELVADSGLEPAELARKLGVSKQTMNDWTKGRTVNIKPDNLIEIVDYFNVEVRWLVRGAGPKYAKPSAPPEVQRATDILTRLPHAQRMAFVTIIEGSLEPHI